MDFLTGVGSASEGVGIGSRTVVVPAPIGVEIVHLRSVGVAVAGAKDDRLLCRTAGLARAPEKFLTQDSRVLGQEQPAFQVGRAVTSARIGY